MENKITYEDLQRVNATIKTTDIKGKNYADVSQRIKAFRMLHPNGSVATEILCLQDGMCVIKAEVKDEAGNLLGTGTAYEKENSTFINKTSYVENCETSAVGRALGMAGFGSDASIASADEVLNAMNNQKKTTTAKKFESVTDAQIEEAIKLGTDIQGVLKYFKVEDIHKISKQDFEIKVLAKKRKQA